MNQKIQCLIDGGFITIEDIREYTQQYMDGVDQYDDEQIDKYYAEQYGDNNIPDVNCGEWECGAGTLHPSTMQECDCFKYENDEQYAEEQSRLLDEEERMLEDFYGQEEQEEYDYPFDLSDNRSDDPEYIIASTSYRMEETYIFEANEKGEILNYGEYGGLCERHGDKDWNNRRLTVESVFPGKYELFKDFGAIDDEANVFHSLYKKITNEKN